MSGGSWYGMIWPSIHILTIRARITNRDRRSPFGKLTIYDKGFDENYESYGEYLARSGDVTMPQISNEEPLRIVCRHFVECIQTGATPRTDARSGLRTVRVLEYSASFDASAGWDGTASLNFRAQRGITFFERSSETVFGLQLGRKPGQPPLHYTWRFDVDEMRIPLRETVNASGWTWARAIL